MRGVLRCRPRRHRITVVRCAVGIPIIVFWYLILSNDQPATGTGRSGEMLFKFDYDHAEKKVGNLPDGMKGNIEEAERALPPPAKHRFNDGDLEIEKAGGNFTVEGMLKPNVSLVFVCTKLYSKNGWLL